MSMNVKYRLFVRKGGMFYAEDVETRKQTSLGSKDRKEALCLLHAKNESHRAPSLNLQMGQVYLSASDPFYIKRDWRWVFDEAIKSKTGSTRRRWENAVKDKAFADMLKKPLMKTKPEELMAVMQGGTVSTNVYLRRVHNLAVDMAWLPRAIIPRRQWPKNYEDTLPLNSPGHPGKQVLLRGHHHRQTHQPAHRQRGRGPPDRRGQEQLRTPARAQPANRQGVSGGH
jgi:hypothetical protein